MIAVFLESERKYAKKEAKLEGRPLSLSLFFPRPSYLCCLMPRVRTETSLSGCCPCVPYAFFGRTIVFVFGRPLCQQPSSFVLLYFYMRSLQVPPPIDWVCRDLAGTSRQGAVWRRGVVFYWLAVLLLGEVRAAIIMNTYFWFVRTSFRVR